MVIEVLTVCDGTVFLVDGVTMTLVDLFTLFLGSMMFPGNAMAPDGILIFDGRLLVTLAGSVDVEGTLDSCLICSVWKAVESIKVRSSVNMALPVYT